MVLFEEKSESDMEVRTPSASVAVGRKRVEESELRDPPHVVLSAHLNPQINRI